MKIVCCAFLTLIATALPAAADPTIIGSFIINSLLSVGGAGILPAVSAAAVGGIVFKKLKQ